MQLMNLLSKEQILAIEADAKGLQELRRPGYISLGLDVTSIFKLGQNTGVIIIKGNEHFGFEHIHSRHDYYSFKAYWKDGKLDYPSKFSPQSIPIQDYTELADALFNEQYIDTENNKKPEVFDLYVGSPDIPLGEGRTYKMIVYKGTKIVHTLYPTNNKYTIKKPTGFHFKKGAVSMNEQLKSCIIEIKIPYFDEVGAKRYTAIVSYNFVKKLEHLRLYIHRTNKGDLVVESDHKSFDSVPRDGMHLLNCYQVNDLKGIEQFIAVIEKDKPTWNAMP